MDQQQFDGLVGLFESARDRGGNPLRMHYLLVKAGPTEFFHAFGGRTEPSDIRSVSKTVLALIAGTVLESTDLTEDSPIWPMIEPLVALRGEESRDRWGRVKVKHLLNHTVGHGRMLMMRGDLAGLDPDQYVDHIVNSPLDHEPGTHYLYSNAGFYLLSAVLQEFLGEDLLDHADRAFFGRLGITYYTWERYGKYPAGATRLWLRPHDLLRVGEVLLAGGEPVVRPEWVERMKQFTAFTPEVDTPTNPHFRRHAYGSSLWLGARDGIFFGHGTDGQTLAIVPERDAIVVTMAEQGDVVRLEELVDRAICLLR